MVCPNQIQASSPIWCSTPWPPPGTAARLPGRCCAADSRDAGGPADPPSCPGDGRGKKRGEPLGMTKTCGNHGKTPRELWKFTMFNGKLWDNYGYPLVNVYRSMENLPCSIEKSTISMVMFHSCIKLPEGND